MIAGRHSQFMVGCLVFQEIEKFRSHMLKRLAKKEICGDSIDEVVGICTDVGTPTLYYYNNPLAKYETSV